MLLLRAALFALILVPIAARAEPPAVEAFAESILLGMQLSAKHGASRGSLAPEALNCVQALRGRAFYPSVEKVMSAVLTAEEVESANTFFATPVGRKYAKHGLLQVYPAVGERAPEPLPEFSSAEYQQLERFAASPSGQALIVRQVMQSPSAKLTYSARIRELMEACRAK